MHTRGSLWTLFKLTALGHSLLQTSAAFANPSGLLSALHSISEEPAQPKDHAGTPICSSDATQAGGLSIEVRITEQNVRGFSLAGSSATQTSVACKGDGNNCLSIVMNGTAHLNLFQLRGMTKGQRSRSRGTQSTASTLPSCDAIAGCPCDIDDSFVLFPYMDIMSQKVLPQCGGKDSGELQPPHAIQVLVIGLGGGFLPSHLLQSCMKDAVNIESVEIDNRVADLATKFFGFHVKEGVNEVEVTDGLTAVQERKYKQKRYDFVLVDCMTNDRVPEDCRSEQFLSAVDEILTPGGVLMQNIWARSVDDDAIASDYASALTAYHDVFGSSVEEVASRDVPHCKEMVLTGRKRHGWEKFNVT